MAFNRGRPELKDLLDQLGVVTEWELLGNHLGIKRHKLNDIKVERHGKASLCKMDMFDYWLRSDIYASWQKVVEALEKMDDFGLLSHTLRVSHGLAVPAEPMQSSQGVQQGYSASAGHSAGVASLAGVQEKTAIQDTSAQKSSNIALIISSLTRDDSNVDAVNAIDPSDPKLSVLQQAITRRALNMAKVLIALGADVNYVNSKNLTAFDIASMMSDENALELLKSVGGLPSSYVYKDTSTKMESEEEMRSQTHSLVLCLDSSGEKALVQLEILNQLEKLTGKKISELFDYMVGSGIGGLFLLAMVYADKTVRQLQRLYYQYMQRMLNVTDAKKSWRELEDFFHDLFRRTRMDDNVSPKVLIAAVNRETTKLKLKFFSNFSKEKDSSLHVYRVACYTCATPEYYGVIGNDTDHYIHGGAICRNLTPSALTFIYENCKKPSITGVVSVGEGIWSSMPYTEDTDLSACAADALVEQIHQNCKSRFSPPNPAFYYRINPLFPVQTPVKLLLEDLVDLHVNAIVTLVGEESSSSLEIKSLAYQLAS
ncbi:85/88 kDa calcium-independent phospholipase A2-like isoform X2 [Halichondria panicea]|uniref:85/88 kDa calcium-independent phospholipase A2-like isoform X2 n=1 Tax=Halichondria panicea TaxID=6063 RepID=UPI00312B85B2